MPERLQLPFGKYGGECGPRGAGSGLLPLEKSAAVLPEDLESLKAMAPQQRAAYVLDKVLSGRLYSAINLADYLQKIASCADLSELVSGRGIQEKIWNFFIFSDLG